METHAVFIIQNNQKELLFVQRALSKKTLPGAWAFPSGTVERSESPADTAIREGREELGVALQPLQTLGEKELKEFPVKLVFVLCNISHGTPFIREPTEIQDFKWMKLSTFFKTYSDSETGHGLIWLRTQKEICKQLEN